MCLHPLLIRNPNKQSAQKSYGGFTPHIDKCLHDTESLYIAVPCGSCHECIRKRQTNILQRFEIMAEYYHIFTFMLSYNNTYLPVLTTSLGEDIPYSNFEDIKLLFKYLRNHNCIDRKFKYLVTSERGGEKHRPHFHGLLFIEKLPSDNYGTILNFENLLRSAVLSAWSCNIGSKKKPIYDPRLTFAEKKVFGKWFRNYDFHYVQPSSNGEYNDIVVYICKYMLKTDKYSTALKLHLKETLEPDEFRSTWSAVRNRYVFSRDFGECSRKEVQDKIKSFIQLSLYDKQNTTFRFYSPTGKVYPLCPIYQRFATREQVLEMRERQCREYGFYFVDLPSSSSLVAREIEKNRKLYDFSYNDVLDIID